MAIANITNNILTDSGIATSSLLSGSGTTNYVSKFTASGVLGNSLIWDNGTNVGIGNTNTSYTLDVTGTVRSTTSAYFATSSGSVGIGTVTSASILTLNGTDPLISFQNAGSTKWQVGLENTSSNRFIFYDNTAAAYRMVITSAGLVGIGTSSPADLLEVKGGFIRLSGTTGNGPQFNLYSNGQTTNNITLAQGFALATDNVGYLYNRANADFVFGTNNTERMRITSGGNLLIGTSTAPSAIGVNDLLVLGKSGSASNAINFSNGSTTNWAYILAESAKMVLGSGSGSSIAFETNAGAERMRITSGGNVLIGSTTDSGQKLQITGNMLNTVTADTLVHRVTGAGGGYCYSYWTNTSGNLIYGIEGSTAAQLQTGSSAYDAVITTASATGLSLGTGQQQYFRITSSGVIRLTALTSNGTVSTQSSNGSLYVSSDANLKIEDGYIENGLEKVLALKPRYFYWKDKEAFSADRQLGFYAQEVNAISEETANTPAEGCGWGIYDRGLVALLTAAIQELNQQNQDLKSRLDKAGL